MKSDGPGGRSAGPETPALDIGRWRDGLGLRWSFEKNSIRVSGRKGVYTIMRLASMWITIYFHGGVVQTRSVFAKCSRDIDGAFESVKHTERQVLLEEMITMALGSRGIRT